MTEILTVAAYVTGGVALGFLIELPLYNAATAAREKYNNIIKNERNRVIEY